ncbi:MAG: putative transport system permease protein [Gemmatimonadaceae bacterium]|jgi:putative ABC transport system permease protein|nr:putative transport system permease protein [Gemmatimonadaceae bacterium]
MRHFSMNAASLIESARVGADSLRTNPTRTTLSTTGVIIGVAALVAAFSITDGVDLWARALIARESSVQDVSITPRTSTVVAGRTIPLNGYPVLTAEDAERAKAEVPGVAQYALTLTGSAPVEYLDRRAIALLTLSTASLADFTTLEILAGRFFTPSEVMHSAPVIVLGHRLAEELAGSHDPLWLIGRAIKVSGRRREVVGVLAPPAIGPEPDLAAFAPIRGGESLLEPTRDPRVPTLRLKANSIEAVEALRTQVLNWLAEQYGTRIEKLNVEVGTQRLENTRQAMLLTKLLLGLLAGLILAVGGIGIMNVLLAAVAERTREIGIRKAVGARRADIQTQFLVESVTVTGAGSVIGFVVGIILAQGGTAVFRMWAHAPIYPVMHLYTGLLAAGSAITVGLVFGTYPARRAAELAPVDAIARE